MNLRFVVGNSREICIALEEINFDKMEEVIDKSVDFSLHLQPRDLDILSCCASKYNDCSPMNLRDCLICYLDEKDRGFFIVDKLWVTYFAGVRVGNVYSLTYDWFEEMKKVYRNEKIEFTLEAEIAVKNLVELCAYVELKKKNLVHIWSL